MAEDVVLLGYSITIPKAEVPETPGSAMADRAGYSRWNISTDAAGFILNKAIPLSMVLFKEGCP